MSRQRKWAVNAHQRVIDRKENGEGVKSYNTRCQKGPSLLQRAGTAQALAFLRSRKEGADMGRAYLDDLGAIYDGIDGAKLLRKAQEAEFSDYLVLSQDLLSISAWLRRFAQIEIPEDKSGD